MFGKIVLPIIEADDTLIEMKDYFKAIDCFVDDRNPENFIYFGESDYFETEFALHTVLIWDNPDDGEDKFEFWEIRESKSEGII